MEPSLAGKGIKKKGLAQSPLLPMDAAADRLLPMGTDSQCHIEGRLIQCAQILRDVAAFRVKVENIG